MITIKVKIPSSLIASAAFAKQYFEEEKLSKSVSTSWLGLKYSLNTGIGTVLVVKRDVKLLIYVWTKGLGTVRGRHVKAWARKKKTKNNTWSEKLEFHSLAKRKSLQTGSSECERMFFSVSVKHICGCWCVLNSQSAFSLQPTWRFKTLHNNRNITVVTVWLQIKEH